MSELAKKHCIPCENGDPPLPDVQEDHLHQNTPDWLLLRENNHKLRRQFKFKTFMEGVDFVNQVAKIAESEGHHPDIYIFYNIVQIDLFTHAVGGLSQNDFILASKIDLIGK